MNNDLLNHMSKFSSGVVRREIRNSLRRIIKYYIIHYYKRIVNIRATSICTRKIACYFEWVSVIADTVQFPWKSLNLQLATFEFPEIRSAGKQRMTSRIVSRIETISRHLTNATERVNVAPWRVGTCQSKFIALRFKVSTVPPRINIFCLHERCISILTISRFKSITQGAQAAEIISLQRVPIDR